jgi:predicted SnoaL-like aldol condensation-catalyzing enzyme
MQVAVQRAFPQQGLNGRTQTPGSGGGLLKSIETGDPKPLGYINPDKYIQHNLAVGDGLAGVRALLQSLLKGSTKVNTVRVFQDGDYVFAHTEYNFFGPKIGFDIFRFEDGQIVEH